MKTRSQAARTRTPATSIDATDDNGVTTQHQDTRDGTCLNDADGDCICDENEMGCLDSSACNYNGLATDEDGSCVWPTLGYDCAGNCLFDDDGDGVCDQDEVFGCQDEEACNYNPDATDAAMCTYPEPYYTCAGECIYDGDNDGICDENEVCGCTDELACNFEPLATYENNSCTYADSGYACDGSCLLDSDSDGICDQNEVTGCQDEAACNYDASATDTGYCDYAQAYFDCDGNCINDEDGNGICDEFQEGGDPNCDLALEEVMSALANGEYCGEGTVWVDEWNECIAIPSCLGDLDNDGNRGTEDLLQLLSVYGVSCPAIYGCTDPLAEITTRWPSGTTVRIILADACSDETALTYSGVSYNLQSLGTNAGLRTT